LKQGIKGCREKLGSIVKVWFFCRKLLLITGEIYPPFFSPSLLFRYLLLTWWGK
jgi:hypothetical protein